MPLIRRQIDCSTNEQVNLCGYGGLLQAKAKKSHP